MNWEERREEIANTLNEVLCVENCSHCTANVDKIITQEQSMLSELEAANTVLRSMIKASDKVNFDLRNEFTKLEADKAKLMEALRALDIDNHYWSDRPCPTCQKITDLINEPFGCKRKANQLIQKHSEGR